MRQSQLDVSLQNIIVRMFLMLFHPIKGFISFSPVLFLVFLVFIKPIFKIIREKDFTLPLMLICVIHLIISATNKIWMGGFCYDPRYLLDILPCVMIFLLFVIDYIAKPFNRSAPLQSIFLCLFSLSIFMQIVGLYDLPGVNWHGVPLAQYILMFGVEHQNDSIYSFLGG